MSHDGLLRFVPPVEATATAGTCYGIFLLCRMIFRTPLVVVGAVIVLLMVSGAYQGYSFGEVWRMGMAMILLVACISAVGCWYTGQLGLGIVSVAMAWVVLKYNFMIQPVVATPAPAAPTSWLNCGIGYGICALALIGLVVGLHAIVCRYCEARENKKVIAQQATLMLQQR